MSLKRWGVEHQRGWDSQYVKRLHIGKSHDDMGLSKNQGYDISIFPAYGNFKCESYGFQEDDPLELEVAYLQANLSVCCTTVVPVVVWLWVLVLFQIFFMCLLFFLWLWQWPCHCKIAAVIRESSKFVGENCHCHWSQLHSYYRPYSISLWIQIQ